MQLSKIDVFVVYKMFFFSLEWNQTIFDQNHGLSFLEKLKFCNFFLNWIFYSLEILFLFLEHHEPFFLCLLCLKRIEELKSWNFWQNSLTKIIVDIQIWLVIFITAMSYCLETIVFYLEDNQTIFRSILSRN